MAFIFLGESKYAIRLCKAVFPTGVPDTSANYLNADVFNLHDARGRMKKCSSKQIMICSVTLLQGGFCIRIFSPRLLGCLPQLLSTVCSGLKLLSCELHFVWPLSANHLGINIPNKIDKTSGQHSFTCH